MTATPKPPPDPYKAPKPAFIPHPHLTSSPLRDNAGLAALRDELHKKSRSN